MSRDISYQILVEIIVTYTLSLARNKPLKTLLFAILIRIFCIGAIKKSVVYQIPIKITERERERKARKISKWEKSFFACYSFSKLVIVSTNAFSLERANVAKLHVCVSGKVLLKEIELTFVVSTL